jgi:hypothetical protein
MKRITQAAVLVSLCLVGSAASEAKQFVRVASLAELYGAVNDAANAGTVVVLAPGSYALAPNGINGGRLELQQDMALQGSPGHPEEVVIDASALPPTSFPGVTGAIRTGRGSNAIEWLTVQGALNGASAISADLGAPNAARVRIAHAVVRGNMRGLDVTNSGPAFAGRVVDVEISESVFMNHLTGAGQAIRFRNNQAPGAIIRATLRGNRSYGNIAGCLAGNTSTSRSRIEIQSFGDRFDGNGNGCVLLAGYGTAVATAEDNYLQMTAHSSTFLDNVGPLPAAFPFRGGILAVGGQAVGVPHTAFRNTLRLELWGVEMAGNGGADINAKGALNTDPQPAGTDNRVEIALHGIATQAIVWATPSEPDAPGSGNTVTIAR